MSTFSCEIDPITRVRYLTSAPYEECAENTVWSNQILPTSIILLVIFVIGFPASLIYALYKSRSLHSDDILQRTIGYLFVPFKKHLYFYGYILIARSLILSIIIGLVPETSTIRRLFILITLVGYFTAQIHFHPYTHKLDNLLEFVALFCLLVTYGSGLAFGSLPSSPDVEATAIFVLILNITFLIVLVLVLAHRFIYIVKSLWLPTVLNTELPFMERIMNILSGKLNVNNVNTVNVMERERSSGNMAPSPSGVQITMEELPNMQELTKQ